MEDKEQKPGEKSFRDSVSGTMKPVDRTSKCFPNQKKENKEIVTSKLQILKYLRS